MVAQDQVVDFTETANARCMYMFRRPTHKAALKLKQVSLT